MKKIENLNIQEIPLPNDAFDTFRKDYFNIRVTTTFEAQSYEYNYPFSILVNPVNEPPEIVS